MAYIIDILDNFVSYKNVFVIINAEIRSDLVWNCIDTLYGWNTLSLCSVNLRLFMMTLYYKRIFKCFVTFAFWSQLV